VLGSDKNPCIFFERFLSYEKKMTKVYQSDKNTWSVYESPEYRNVE